MRWSYIDLPLLRPPALQGSMSLGSVYRTQPLTWLNIVKEPRYPHFTARTPTEPRCGQRIVQCLIITSFLSTSSLGFMANRWNPMQAAPLGANILLGDQPLAQLCQVHFSHAAAQVDISEWAVPWKCPPISRYLSQQSEEMGSREHRARSRRLREKPWTWYHSISDSFCPKSKPLLGE